MLRLRLIALLALASAVGRVAGGCSVDELDIEGKRCPCVTGFTCDLATSTCVPDGTDAGPVILVDGGPRDAPTGAFVIKQLTPRWRTSKSVRWDWEVSGEPSDFAEYQLIVGGSEDAVLRQDSTTSLFDRRINPELGSYASRDVGATASNWTVTDRHSPGRKVFAKLVVRDKAGRENASNVVSADTLTEDAALVIFGDAVADGAVLTPSELKRVTTDCFSNSAGCLQIAKIACGDAATCGIDMGVQGYDTKTVTGMTAAKFDTAFVEIAVRGGSGASSKPHADLVVSIGAPACRINGNRCRFRFASGWSFRPGAKEYRLIQVPLGVLLLDTPNGSGPALTHADLAANGLKIEGITIDGEWTAGANIGLDHAHVRW